MKLVNTFSLSTSIITLKNLASTTAQQASQCDTTVFCTFPAIGMLDETYLMNESMCQKQGCCFHPVQKNVGGSYIGFCYEGELAKGQQKNSMINDSAILDQTTAQAIFDDLTGLQEDNLPPIELTLKIADINKNNNNNKQNSPQHDTIDPNLEKLRRLAPLTNPFADLASTQQDMLRKTNFLATQLADSNAIAPAVPSMEEILEEIRRNSENEKLAQGILSILAKNDDESINADKVNRIRNKYGEIVTLNERVAKMDSVTEAEDPTINSTTEQLQALIRKQSDDLNNQLKLFEMILEVLIKNNTSNDETAEIDANTTQTKQVDLLNPETIIEIHNSNSEISEKEEKLVNFSPEITYETAFGLQIAKETGYNLEFTSMNAAFSQGLEDTCSAYRSMSMCCKNSDSPFCDFTGNQVNFKNYWTVYTGITDRRILGLQSQSFDNMAGTWDTANYEDVYSSSGNSYYSSMGRPSILNYQTNYNKLQPRAIVSPKRQGSKKGRKYSKFSGMTKIHRIGRRAVKEEEEAQEPEPIGQLAMGSVLSDEEIDQLDTFNATASDIVHQEELQQRIVGGSEAFSTDLKKHMAYMYLSYSNLPFCGGTLINDQWIITAAHCVTTYCSKESSLDEVRVMLGKYYRDAWKPQDGMDFGVSHIICHRENCKASGEPRLHDMALIKLDRKVHVNKDSIKTMISPAKLPSSYDEPVLSKDCITLGWGATTTNGYGSEEHLKMAVMPVYSNYQCNQPDWRSCTIRSGMICAGSADDRPCKGDSGGPLFCPYRGDENHYVLQGVYSYGRCNRVLKKPAVYTRVSHYLEWIRDTVKEN